MEKEEGGHVDHKFSDCYAFLQYLHFIVIPSLWIEPQKFIYIVLVYLINVTKAIWDVSRCSLVGSYQYLSIKMQAACSSKLLVPPCMVLHSRRSMFL